MQMLGLVHESQPTYFPCLNVTHAYNGGLQLLDLKKLRLSFEYNSITSSQRYSQWTDVRRAQMCAQGQSFGRWNLGDQDFYVLLATERPEWFYSLPCAWNVQLCTVHFMKANHRLLHLFPEFGCAQKPTILHGNCDSVIWGPDYMPPTCNATRHALRRVTSRLPHAFAEVVGAFCEAG